MQITTARNKLERAGLKRVYEGHVDETWKINGNHIYLILTNKNGEVGPGVEVTHVDSVFFQGYPVRNLTAAIKMAVNHEPA